MVGSVGSVCNARGASRVVQKKFSCFLHRESGHVTYDISMTEHVNSIYNQVLLTKDAVDSVIDRLVKMEEKLGELDEKSVPVSKMEERANKIEKN